MQGKTILIIGGGIAGLSAGIYAQKNGYRSQVFELHYLPGGLCTSWRRGRYVFDGSIRYLAGAGANSSVYSLWQELGVANGLKVYYYDEFERFESSDGRTLRLLTNIDQLERHLLELAPEDREVILELAMPCASSPA